MVGGNLGRAELLHQPPVLGSHLLETRAMCRIHGARICGAGTAGTAGTSLDADRRRRVLRERIIDGAEQRVRLGPACEVQDEPVVVTQAGQVGVIVTSEDELALIADEQLELVTVTGVKAHPDLRHARVWFSSLSIGKAPDEVSEVLAVHRVRLQSAVARQLRLKRTPELAFQSDPAIAVGTRVEEILREIVPADMQQEQDDEQDDEEAAEEDRPR